MSDMKNIYWSTIGYLIWDEYRTVYPPVCPFNINFQEVVLKTSTTNIRFSVHNDLTKRSSSTV